LADAPPPCERSPALGAIPHGFFGSRGGASIGAVAGLNCGFGAGDEPAAVAENRRRVADTVLPGAPLVSVHQVHSPAAVVVEQVWDDAHRPQADALVTARPGIVLGVVTADCAPILLADDDAGVVAAAHAGWRGAHGGVIEATVAAMEGLGARPSRIVAAIGPAIAQASYEVDDGFREQFGAEDAGIFAPGRAGHWQFDLAAYVAARLAGSGVGRIDDLAIDTYPPANGYFSFRRATHRGEPTYGRQLSAIGLPTP